MTAICAESRAQPSITATLALETWLGFSYNSPYNLHASYVLALVFSPVAFPLISHTWLLTQSSIYPFPLAVTFPSE